MSDDRLISLRNKSIKLFNALKLKLDTDGKTMLNEYESTLTEIQILENEI